MKLRVLLLLLVAAPCFAQSPSAAPAPAEKLVTKAGALTPAELQQVVGGFLAANSYPDDVKVLAFLESEQNHQKVARQAIFFTRNQGTYEFLMLLTKPKTESGNGYLRLDNNLWSYDARQGRWERRTNRDRLAGTDIVESDLNTSWQSSFVASDDGLTQVGATQLRKVTFRAKPGVDVPFPIRTVWLDPTLVARKVQDFALSGKLMRTLYAPQWMRLRSKSTGKDYWYPKELRIFDDVEKGRSTVMLVQQLDTSGLPSNTFTKAWLEGQSR